MKTVSIDTSSNEEIVVSLLAGEKEFVSKKKMDKTRAQAVLPMVDELLQKHKLTLQDLTGIEVNVGPGSFTGLRVGVAIANTLGYLLKIPINGMPVGTPAEAVYS